MRNVYRMALIGLLFGGCSVHAQMVNFNDEAYLSWTRAQSETIGKSTRHTGKAGGYFDTRIISTNNAINYELRATLLTPEVIRAFARYYQLNNRLSDTQTKALVEEAENSGDLVVIVEINPNEGSGVIPLDWRAFLQPRGAPKNYKGAIPGVKSPQLRKVVALNSLYKRNYEYDMFWVVFPLVDDKKSPLFAPDMAEIELVVGIYNKEGTISWPITESMRRRIQTLTGK